jgi:hypothetical protein
MLVVAVAVLIPDQVARVDQEAVALDQLLVVPQHRAL